MKTITLQLYTFDELSEEVQKEIIERERWNIMDQCLETSRSITMMRLKKTFSTSRSEPQRLMFGIGLMNDVLTIYTMI